MHEQMKKNEEKYATVEDPEQTSLEVGLSGIKIQGGLQAVRDAYFLHASLSQTPHVSRINNYNFNWDRMTSFEGDTGPYLQYAHVRLTSLTRKNPELLPLPPPEQIATETLAEQPAAREIVFCWARTWTWFVRRCGRTSRVGWSHSRSGWRMRFRARGRRLWSRARRTSSGRVRGCGFVCVRGMWLGLRCGC